MKMIYAQLVRNLHSAGVELKEMFPSHFDEEVYADFPPSTQNNNGWAAQFEDYVDNLFNKRIVKMPTS